MAAEADRPQDPVGAALTDALAGASGGSGRLLLILGEAGIGKTTTAREAAAVARRSGMTVRWSACWSGGGTVAHAPWLAVLSGLGPAGRGALEALLGSGSDQIGEAAAATAARSAAYAAVVATLEQVAAERPVLIVLDDLHWADAGTLQLLDVVAAHLPGVPVVVIGTYRSTDVLPGSPLTRLGGRADRVELHGVDDAGIAALLGAHINPTRAAALAPEVRQLTAGNPFLVVQLGRLLADEPAALSHAALPTGARDLLEQRLDAIGSDQRAVLVAAAALGNPCAAADLAAILERDPAEIDAALSRAAALRVVERAPGVGAWRFVHDLFRQAALDAGDPTAIAEIHRIAAALLASRSGEPAAIADHLLHAGPDHALEAAQWSVQAADRAIAALAWEEAVTHYETALGTLRRGDDDVRATALAGLGRARLLHGDEAGATAAFEQLGALGRSLGNADIVARAALGWSADLSGFEVRLFDQRQIDLLEEAAVLLADATPPQTGLRATVLARLSVALSLVASDERRLALADEAVDVARRSGDRIAIARALAAHCDAIAGPDRSEDREAEAGEIIAIADAEGDGPLELLGRRLRFVARLEQGDVAGVEADIAAFGRRADAVGSPLYRWYVPLWKAQAAVVAGNTDAARADLDEVEALGRASGSTNAPVLALVLRLAVHTIDGELEAPIAALAAMGETSPGIAQHISSLGAFALAHERAGRRANAVAYLDRAAALGVDAVPFDAEWLPNATSLVQAAAALDHPLLPDALARLEPWAHRVSFEGIGAGLYGSASRFVAIGCTAMGRHDDAVAYAERAVATNRRLGGALAADALRTLADATEARDGMTEAAAALHTAADEAYAALGLAHLVRGGAVPSVAPPPAREPANELRRAGDVWHLTFGGVETVLRHSKGMADLAVLLARPDVEVHVTELGGVPEGITAGNGGEALDRRAVAAYKDRLVELAEEIDDADAAHDLGRAERARVEHDALVDQLSAAIGLGGRVRSAGPEPIERLRKAVSARLRDAIRRIDAAHPALGRHLTNAVHTGVYCAYRPEPPVSWRCQT